MSITWDEILATEHHWIGGRIDFPYRDEEVFLRSITAYRGTLSIEYGTNVPGSNSRWITGEEHEFHIIGWKRPERNSWGDVVCFGGFKILFRGEEILLSKG